jgi:hypothetical protein
MSIRAIVSAYRDQKITAEEAFTSLTQTGLLPEAFMQLLLALIEEQEAHDSLVRG